MGAFVDHLDLVPEWRGVLFLIFFTVGAHGFDAGFLDLDDFFLRGCQFRGIAPDFAPVTVSDTGSNASADGVEHPFSGVGIAGTEGAVAAEIV